LKKVVDRPVVIKIGGSVISDKRKVFSLRIENLRRIISEISSYKGPLILIHGGGSFGHPLAKIYRLNEGYSDPNQLLGVWETHKAMRVLSDKVLGILQDEGFKVIPFEPISLFYVEDGIVLSSFLNPIKKALQLGFTPILFGDVVFDQKKGFSILSGDTIAKHLALEFNARMVVMCSDVDGVFIKRGDDEGSKVELIREINERNVREVLDYLSKSHVEGLDVTGGIFNKVKEMWDVASNGIEVFLVNALVEGRLRDLLLGKPIVSTRIVKRSG